MDDDYCVACGHYQAAGDAPARCECDADDCRCAERQWEFD